MPQYAYRARDRRGSMVSGVLVAQTEDDLQRLLRHQGMTILKVTLRGGNAVIDRLRSVQVGKPRVKSDDVVYFANQLAVMIETGVPLPEALNSIVQQTGNSTFRAALEEVTNDVESGQQFSEALEKHGRYFNSMFVSLVRAGEASGNLSMMLTRVAEDLVQSQETAKKVKGSMTYPIFMLTMSAIVVVVLMPVVLPKFKGVYANKGAALPLPTQVLMTTSDFMVDNWMILLPLLAALVAGLWFGGRTARGRRICDTLKIRLPVLGNVCRKLYIARSFRVLGIMVDAGVPVIDALKIARQTARNSHFQAVFDQAAAHVSDGEPLADQFFTTELVPVTMSQMIHAGERSGKLGDVLIRVSGFCDREFQAAVKQMTTMLEPALVGFMGLFIGGVAMALLLPMMTMSSVIAK
jgi:type IV pilus assembly protein PilC